MALASARIVLGEKTLMRYANGQEETLKNCMQRRVKARHLPKKYSDVSSSSWHEGQEGDVM